MLQKWLAKVPAQVVDVVLALILGGVGMAQLARSGFPFKDDGPERPGFGPGPGGGPPPVLSERNIPPDPDTLAYVLLGLCAGALVLRRWSPVSSLIAVLFFGTIYLAHGQNPMPIQLIVLVAIYGAVADSSMTRVQAIALSLGSAALLALAVVIGDTPRDNSRWAQDAAWILAAMFLGDSVRSRRAYELEAEKNRDEEMRRRSSEERLQIARELHDVVGHNISLINVQAGAGEHVLFKDPTQSREVFANIKRASHETLQELRSMVGVLREPTNEAQRQPTQGLAALEQLVKSMNDAGQQVDLKISGRERTLPGVLDLSLYRILQEALTNTVRHAPGSQVHVEVDYGSDKVRLEVANSRGNRTNGDGLRMAGTGHGVVGMKERAAALGGELTAASQTDGGFLVKAVLPIEEGVT